MKPLLYEQLYMREDNWKRHLDNRLRDSRWEGEKENNTQHCMRKVGKSHVQV